MFTCRVVWGEFYFIGLLYFCTITCWNTQETVRNSIYLSFGAQSFYLAFIGLDYSSVSKLNSLAGLRLPELSFIQILSHYVICYPVIYSLIISCLSFLVENPGWWVLVFSRVILKTHIPGSNSSPGKQDRVSFRGYYFVDQMSHSLKKINIEWDLEST